MIEQFTSLYNEINFQSYTKSLEPEGRFTFTLLYFFSRSSLPTYPLPVEVLAMMFPSVEQNQQNSINRTPIVQLIFN